MKSVRTLLLTLGSCFFALLLVEVGLRTLGRFTPPNPPRPARPDLYVRSEAVGYHLWPSTRSCSRYPADRGRVLELVSNSDGFRSSRELGEPDPRPHILVLGDSFVQGLGVEEGERMLEDLERLEPGWRVDGLGMSGWGVGLMLRALAALGPKAKPDVVVLAFYTDDFRRAQLEYSGAGYRIPKYRVENGKLVEHPYPAWTGWRRSRLAYALLRSIARLDRNRYSLHTALLNRFQAVVASLGARPALAFLPGKGGTAEDNERRAFLAAWASDHRVPYLDLTDAMQAAGGKALFIPHDSHWNVRGHQVAAQGLHALLGETMKVEPMPGFDTSVVPHSGNHASHCFDAVHELPAAQW